MKLLSLSSALLLTLLSSVGPSRTPAVVGSADGLWHTLAKLSFPTETRTPFRETRSSKLLRNPAQQTGELWIAANGDFVMQILTPRQEERRLSEQRLSLTRSRTDKNGKLRSKQRRIKLDRTKGSHQLLLSIVDVLEGNITKLQQRFDISAEAVTDTTNQQAWSIALTPKNSELRNDMQQLLLQGEDDKLRSLRTTRSNNGWQQIDLLARPVTGSATATHNGD